MLNMRRRLRSPTRFSPAHKQWARLNVSELVETVPVVESRGYNPDKQWISSHGTPPDEKAELKEPGELGEREEEREDVDHLRPEISYALSHHHLLEAGIYL